MPQINVLALTRSFAVTFAIDIHWFVFLKTTINHRETKYAYLEVGVVKQSRVFGNASTGLVNQLLSKTGFSIIGVFQEVSAE